LEFHNNYFGNAWTDHKTRKTQNTDISKPYFPLSCYSESKNSGLNDAGMMRGLLQRIILPDDLIVICVVGSCVFF
jgi:hypothetical protein